MILKEGGEFSMELKQLVENGFLIYLEEEKFVVEKKPTLFNKIIIEKKYLETIEEAIEFVNNCTKEKRWKAIVRYNRGLGIEYKNIDNLLGASLKEVENIAKLEAEKILGDSILEIKIKENF